MTEPPPRTVAEHLEDIDKAVDSVKNGLHGIGKAVEINDARARKSEATIDAIKGNINDLLDSK